MSTTAANLASSAFPAHSPPLSGGVALTSGSIAIADASGALASSIGVTAATNPAPATIQAINSTLTPAIDQFHQIGNGIWSKALLRIVDTDFNRAHGNALDISWGTTGFQINDASTTSGVTITTAGTGYYVGDAVSFSSGTSGQGSGATGVVATVDGSGAVTGITVTNPGGGWKTNDYPTGIAVTVSGASGGSGFVGTGNLNTIGRAGIQLAGFTLPDVTGGSNTGSIAISEMGCGPAIAAYKSTGFRSVFWGNSVFANYAYDIGGALEVGALDGAHTALINSGHDFGPGADSCLLGVAIATTGAITTITVGNEMFPANGTSAQPGIARFGVPGSAAYPGAAFSKHTTLYAQITEGANKETFSYTGVSGNTLTGVARGINGRPSFTFTTTAEIRPIYFMGTAAFRVDNDINAGVGIQPNNNAFDGRIALYIGIEGKSGAPPSNTTFQATFAGDTTAKSVTLANNNGYFVKNVAGTAAAVAKIDSSNQVLIGDIANASGGTSAAIFYGGAVESFRARASDGGFRHNNVPLGFFATAPTTKQTVSGAKGSNAALGSVIAALVAYGIITDTTTA